MPTPSERATRAPAGSVRSEDARDVGAFLGAPGGASRFQRVGCTARPPGLTPPRSGFSRRSKTPQRRTRPGELGQGDAWCFVTIDSHFRPRQGSQDPVRRQHAPAGARQRRFPPRSLARTLGQLADYGCTVMLMLDTLHEKRPTAPQTNRGLIEWSRLLYRRNVITMPRRSTARVRPSCHAVMGRLRWGSSTLECPGPFLVDQLKPIAR